MRVLNCVSFYLAGTKILVATGYAGSSWEPGRHTEIVDLEDPSFQCEVGQYPRDAYAAVGGMIGQTPFVCGGHDGGRIKNCYSLQENGDWQEDPVAILGENGRWNAADGDVVLHDQLVLVGGASYKKTMELAGLNTEVKMLDIELPIGRGWGCVARWDDDTFIVVGGYHSKDDTYFVNIINKTITDGPKLLQGRHYIACHEMKVNDEEYIVVTGGFRQTDGWLKTTEMLSKSNFGKGWQKSKYTSWM